MMRPAVGCAFLLTLIWATSSWGQAADAPAKNSMATARVTKLRIFPAKAPIPALRYHLLPWAGELKSGNAAVFYQRAHSPEFVTHLFRAPDFVKLMESIDQPMDEDLRRRSAAFAGSAAVRELDHAARCEYVDWQLADRLREDGVNLLLPDVQSFRTLAMLLALRARLEMHDREVDKAVYSLQTGLAMSRHISDSLTLINGLVGAAIANIMLNRAEELLQLRETPNLYWAFTELPGPLVSLQRGFQGERIMIDATFPGLRDAIRAAEEGRPIPVAPIDRYLAMAQKLNIYVDPIRLALQASARYPQARQYFLDRGRKAEEIGALPVSQVVLMYELANYDRWYDEYYKLTRLPYWQARPLLTKLDRQRGDKPALAEFLQLLPSTARVMEAQARLERRVALLRAVEALRLYGKEHGELPEKLADVRDVPIPDDPMTGQTFLYERRRATSATLDAPPPQGEVANTTNAQRYELLLAVDEPRTK